MKILIFNGSPRKEKSNSLKLTNAFIEGIKSVEDSIVKKVNVYSLDINSCIGCFNCWSKTPGVCVFKDDMGDVIQDILDYDLIIWSFPLYYYSLPSKLKALLDRLLPMNLPFMSENNEGGGGHPSRYDLSGKRYFLISTCGFYTSQGNYNSVTEQFNRIYGSENYDYIFCGQGELFSVPPLKARTDQYLNLVFEAGREYVESGISKKTRDSLTQLLYPRKVFEEMADASWGIEKPSDKKDSTGKKEGLTFTRQMASLYNPRSWTKDKVLEFEYTDIGENYQIIMKKDGYEVLSADFLPYTTKIITSLSLWQKIGSGEISGTDAMMDRQYSYDGDFDILLNWDKYFGYENEVLLDDRVNEDAKTSKMIFMLIPWTLMWISLPINPILGGVLTIFVTGLIQFAFIRHRATIYDHLTSLFVSVISIGGIIGYDLAYLLPISYLLFGLMWLVSVFLEIPLSAHYSMNDYGKEKALKNKLFMKTNRIISGGWGLIYLVSALVSMYVLRSDYASYAGLISMIGPAFMGIFTVFFQKWYPENYAKNI